MAKSKATATDVSPLNSSIPSSEEWKVLIDRILTEHNNMFNKRIQKTGTQLKDLSEELHHIKTNWKQTMKYLQHIKETDTKLNTQHNLQIILIMKAQEESRNQLKQVQLTLECLIQAFTNYNNKETIHKSPHITHKLHISKDKRHINNKTKKVKVAAMKKMST